MKLTQPYIKQLINEEIETILQEGVGGDLWRSARSPQLQRSPENQPANPGGTGDLGGFGAQAAAMMGQAQRGLGGGGGDVDPAALMRSLGGGGGGSVPTFGKHGGSSIGGPGGAVHVRHGDPPDFLSALVNYSAPGAEKMPWELNPELIRAMFPQGMPDPFAPGAGSDTLPGADTYPYQGTPSTGRRGIEAEERQASRGHAPGRTDLNIFQPEVRNYEPKPRKTTDKRSWTHAPPEKNWSKQESWSTGDAPQPGEAAEDDKWEKWALGAGTEGPWPGSAEAEDNSGEEEDNWEDSHLRIMQQAQKMGAKGSGKRIREHFKQIINEELQSMLKTELPSAED